MGALRVTIIGQDLFKIAEQKFELVGLSNVNQVNNGMLGNLKTLTYLFDLDDLTIIDIRNKLMKSMSEDNMRLMPMFVNGDWNRIVVIKPFKT